MSRLQRLAKPSLRYLKREEAMRLSEADWKAHEARLAAMRNGTFDFSSCLVPPPQRVVAMLDESGAA